jgi:hypothetical protein
LHVRIEPGGDVGYDGFLPDLTTEVFFPFQTISRVTVDRKKLDMQYKDWGSDVFDVSFADLTQASNEFQTLEFEDVKKIISDEAAKGAEVFEVFGIKFPTGQITVSGILALLGVQLYFFLYLKQLFGKLHSDDAGWDVPWIGMNLSRAARVTFFASLVLFPCIAVALLGGRAISQLTSGYWEHTAHFVRLAVRFGEWNPWIDAKILCFVAATIIAILLGVQSWRLRPTVSEETNYCCPSQLFE